MRLKNIIWINLILVFLVSSCQLFSPSNVKTVVKEDYLDYWRLSPTGDYIIYGGSRGDFLLNLATGQAHEFDCNLYWWDDYIFGCYEHREVFAVDVKTLTTNPLISINLTEESENNLLDSATESFVNQLLVKTELIYYPTWTTDTIYILAPNYQLNVEENYIVSGLTNPDKLLEKYNYKVVPYKPPNDPNHEKVFSPDSLYYIDLILDGFAIYDANNNQIVSQYVEEHLLMLDILGWAPDSSGVYFVSERAGMTIVGPEAVRKLTIPDE